MSRDERRWLLPHQADGPKTSYFRPGRRAIALLVAGILAFYVAGAIHLHGALEPPQEKDAGQRDGDGRVELDAAHVSFPLDCSFRQYTLSADDEGLAYISGDGRAFRSDHTNLFGRGVTGKIISVDANAFLIRSNGECCRFMDSGDEILLKPTSFFNYRSVGNAVFDTAMATLWYVATCLRARSSVFLGSIQSKQVCFGKMRMVCRCDGIIFRNRLRENVSQRGK
ncbi:unnamed protein product [Aphanomyces euteiches]